MARRKGSYTRDRQKQPVGRVKIWAAIRFLKRFTIEDLQITTECEYRNCWRYVQALRKTGIVRAEAKPINNGQQFAYCLDPRFLGTEAPIPQKDGQVFNPNNSQVLPVLPSAQANPKKTRDRAWEAMQALGQFTQSDLAEASKGSKDNLRKFVRALLIAGYLEVVQPGLSKPNKRATVYRLAQNTGEKAPIVQRDGSIFDPNNKGGDSGRTMH